MIVSECSFFVKFITVFLQTFGDTKVLDDIELNNSGKFTRGFVCFAGDHPVAGVRQSV